MRAMPVAIGLAVLLIAPLRAQTSATLQGRVFDQSDALIARATVRVRSKAVGVNRSVVTDDEGRYQVAGIPAGVYEVVAEAAGFRSESSRH